MRSRIEDDSSGLSLAIPSKGSWPIALFLIAWLGGWTMGEVGAISTILGWLRGPGSTGIALLLFWLLGWTIGGALALYQVIWQLAGRELVRLDGVTLSLSYWPIPFPRPRQYDWSQVTNVRVSPPTRPRHAYWGAGTIAFDYGARTVRFGAELDEAEAAMLINTIQKRFLS